VNENGVRLTTYFDERARVEHGLLVDALFELYERNEIHTSVLLRGVDGFAQRHRHHTDRFLTLSESLPAVSVAIDTPERIERMLPDALAVARSGFATLERTRVVSGTDLDRLELGSERGGPIKLTLYGGRAARSDRDAGYVGATRLLRDAGAASATVLLPVDGTLHGERRRARFFARNAQVPLVLETIGDPDRVGSVLPRVLELLDDPVATIEPVQICKLAGELRSDPWPPERRGGAPLASSVELTVRLEEQAKHAGHPLSLMLVRELRQHGAAGATVLRGVHGFYGEHLPYADPFLALRRNVPVHVIVIDSPPAIGRLWPIVDRLTREAGIVTSGLVTATMPRTVAGYR
jgi:PII-like signaling protein